MFTSHQHKLANYYLENSFIVITLPAWLKVFICERKRLKRDFLLCFGDGCHFYFELLSLSLTMPFFFPVNADNAETNAKKRQCSYTSLATTSMAVSS